MTEWGVVAVIIALVGLFATVMSPVIKLNTTLTRLNDQLDALGKTLNEHRESAKETHKRLFAKTEEHERKLEEHEIRIRDLERVE